MPPRPGRPCPLCENPNTPVKFRLKEREIRRCIACAAEFVDPKPSPEALDRLYRSGAYESRDYFADERIHPDFRRAADAIFRWKSAGRWLDLGSGRGEMLRLARDQGFEVLGVEAIDSFCTALSNRHGIPMRCGFFETLELPDSSFDVVCAIDFIEHLPDPALFLQKARRILKPGGLLYVSTVDLVNLINITGTMVYRISGGLFNGPVERLFPLEHITYFTRSALISFLERHGFETVTLRGRNYRIERIGLTPPQKVFFHAAYAAQSLLGWNMNIDVLARRRDGLIV